MPVPRSKALAELDAAERAWRAAARRATEASLRYHWIRTLGAASRRALVAESSQVVVPKWAVGVRRWEGALGDGAARQAGLECIRASRVFHLASARKVRWQWELAGHDERERLAADYGRHLQAVARTNRRLDKNTEGTVP